MISRDKIRILTRNVKIALGIKRYIKGMIDSGIHLRVALYEDLGKVVLSIFIERALELQDFAVFEIRVDHIQILIRTEYESAKLTERYTFEKDSFCLSLSVIHSHQSNRREYCSAKLSLRRREN